MLRSIMKQFVALLVCLSLPVTLFSADNGFNVRYDGGSLPAAKSGMSMKLYVDQGQIRLVRDKEEVARVPSSAVTDLSYGQDVHRRVGAAIGLAVVSFGIGALMALTKSKKHFVGITWADGSNKGGFAVQCDKKEFRGIIAGLEGVTGKKAVDSATISVKN